MKKYFSKSNIIFAFILIFFIYKQAPTVINNFNSKGIKINSSEYNIISPSVEKEKILFPNPQINSLVIFWATWCSPCKLEMKRLENSVNSGRISKAQILAINPFETNETILQFITKNNYPFTFISAPELSNKLNIHTTPTTIFLNGNSIYSMSSGISIIGIWLAEFFLKQSS